MNKIEKSTQISAIAIGISLLLMAVVAGFAFGYIHSNLVISNNNLKTMENIKDTSLFTYEVLGFTFIFILDMFVAIGFYIYLNPIHKILALASGVVRLIYSIIFMVAIINLYQVFKVIDDNSIITLVKADQVMGNINNFENIWSFALIIFGLHLVLVGIVSLKCNDIPKILGLLVLFAGISYIVVNGLLSAGPNFETLGTTLESILMMPMTIGELGYGIWLLVKGRKIVFI